MGVCLIWSLLKFIKMKCCSSIPSTMRQCIASPLHIIHQKSKCLELKTVLVDMFQISTFVSNSIAAFFSEVIFWINAKFRSKRYALCILQLDLISPAYLPICWQSVSGWTFLYVCGDDAPLLFELFRSIASYKNSSLEGDVKIILS